MSEAKSRAEMILQVRSGAMTATQAAKVLGVSRKTYYEWETKGLKGLMAGLENQEAGRPKTAPSPREAQLEAKVADLQKKLQVAEQTAQIRKLLREMGSKKNRRRSKRS